MKPTKNTGGSSLITYSAGHFLVDFACGYILWSMYAKEELDGLSVISVFILYNFFAFATQFIFGILADRIRSNGSAFAIAGCTSAAIGMLVGGHVPYLTVALMGLGNAFYHIGGGIDAVTRDRGMTRAGIFVSTGALGIALGCHMGADNKIPVFFIVALLITTAVAISAFCTAKRPSASVVNVYSADERESGPHSDSAVGSRSDSAVGSRSDSAVGSRSDSEVDTITSKPLMTAVLPAVTVLLVAVFIRSWAGFVADAPSSDSTFAFLLPAAAAFAGKFAGGILSDLLGARRVGTVALLLSAPLFFLGSSRFLFFLAATFLFNIAMPITLCELARRLPGHEGFAFGLTTLALFIGYVLDTILPVSLGVAPALTALLALIAAVAVGLTASDRKN